MLPHEYLETNGWCRGAFCDGSKRCALGAVFASKEIMARIMGRMYVSDYPPIREALDRRGWTGDLVSWNDAPGRTKEEVVELLKEAFSDAR